MKNDMSSGFGQADLSISYHHHDGGIKAKFNWKDFQVASAEFIGSFFLSLIVGSTKITTTPDVAPYAIGLGLVSIVYMTGPVSGGMVNPAVTVGLVVRNKLSLYEAAYCIISQLAGALFAGLICYILYGNSWSDVGYPRSGDFDNGQAFAAEFVQTFALVTAVLNTASTTAQANNSYFGLAIGFVVLSGALIIGGVSGACFNPGVAMLTLLHGDYTDFAIYFFAPTFGGFFAGLVFRITNPAEMDNSDPLLRLFCNVYQYNPEGKLTKLVSVLTQEFIGTFYLSWTVALLVDNETSNGFLAVGAIVASMVYAGGSISGAHYNPCITLGVYLRGLKENPQILSGFECISFMVIQFIAVLVGGSFASYINGGVDNIGSPSINTDSHTFGEAFLGELCFSLLLVLTVLSTATGANVSGNSYFGIAIGFVLTTGAIAVGDISGGVLNPAVGLGLPLLTQRHVGDVWVYIVSEFLGGAMAAGIYTYWYHGRDIKSVIKPEEKESAHNLANSNFEIRNVLNASLLRDSHMSSSGY